ncbi:MAG: thioesterase family protein [Deltaproteobacteria bacterium]
MKKGLVPGLRYTASYVTTLDMRAGQLTSDVLSTPALIGLMEKTSVELATPYLEDHEQTVGTHVDVRHRAPTRIGQTVVVTAELLECEGNKLRFSVTALNDEGVKIGEGSHRRAVINTNHFAQKS